MPSRSSGLARGIVAALLTCASALAMASERVDTVTVVVPFAAGGPTDAVARALAAAMAAAGSVRVTVDNRPGAGGTRGAGEVALAAADGRTLLLHHVGMATAPALYRRLPFDPQRDFAPLGLVVDVPMTLVAPPGRHGWRSAGLARQLRDSADRLVVAYAGAGAASHLCGQLLAATLGRDLIQVPYGGTGPALQDLLAGGADLLCDQTTNTAAPIRAGQLQALGVTSRQRLPGLPAVPTLAESGLGGLELTIWHGLYAPAGTPPAVLAELTRLLQAGLASPAFQTAMAEADVLVASPRDATPGALTERLARETARWSPILRRMGHHAD